MTAEIQAAGGRFAIDGRFAGGRAFGRGRIHESFLAEWEGGGGVHRFLLQRLNETVFPDIDGLMENVARVVAHIAAKRPAARRLELVPSRDGRPYARDDAGRAWRAWVFLDGTTSLARVATTAAAREAGFAFGRFLADLADLPGRPLRETIPGFHDVAARLAALPAGAPEARRFDRLAEGAEALADGLRAGRLPLRPVHNDPKLDNLLVDQATGRAVAIVDLDTTMPGSAATDFGDLVRSALNPGEAPAGAGIDLDVLRAVAAGFLDGADGLLVPAEIELLPIAPRLIAAELAARFLADHLAGDRWFRVARPGDNLRRARTQLALAEDLLAREPEIRRIVDELAEERA